MQLEKAATGQVADRAQATLFGPAKPASEGP
jgi:hypothetical protein